MNKAIERIKNGIVTENPTFVQILGMCPTLAVTTSAINGLGMGLSTTVILIMSNLMISALRNVIPNRVRIPAYIVIVASFVTIIDFLLQAFIPSLSESLGGYIKLIVVNCIILGRAESYASKNPVIPSVFDGVGMGLGFTVGLTAIGLVRELIGAGSVFGFEIPGYTPIAIFVQSPGAFLVLAFLIAFLNFRKMRKKKTASNDTVCRMEDCAHCGNTSCGGKFFDFDGENDVVGRVGQKPETVKEEPKQAEEPKKEEEPKQAEEPKKEAESKQAEESKQEAEPKQAEEPKQEAESKQAEESKQEVEPKQAEESKQEAEPKQAEESKQVEEPKQEETEQAEEKAVKPTRESQGKKNGKGRSKSKKKGKGGKRK